MYWRTVRTFSNLNYYHKLTLSLRQPCQKTFFLNCVFPLSNINFLFVLFISVFLTLKSSSYGSIKHFHTLYFLTAIITMWSPAWFYSLFVLLSADIELNQLNLTVYLLVIFPYAIKLFFLKAYIAIHKFYTLF